MITRIISWILILPSPFISAKGLSNSSPKIILIITITSRMLIIPSIFTSPGVPSDSIYAGGKIISSIHAASAQSVLTQSVDPPPPSFICGTSWTKQDSQIPESSPRLASISSNARSWAASMRRLIWSGRVPTCQTTGGKHTPLPTSLTTTANPRSRWDGNSCYGGTNGPTYVP